MKVTNNVVILVVVLVLGFGLVTSKRQKPHDDEIERVINDTHSMIWKCSEVECAFGTGARLLCGTSVPFSMSIDCVQCVEGFNYSDTHEYLPCQSCRKCSEHEETSGQCTPDEDTTECLSKCHKGFYWDNTTHSCHPCSDCCGNNITNHEKQCENSDLPISHQCQQTNTTCYHVTNTNASKGQNDPTDTQQAAMSKLTITAIILASMFVVGISVILVLWKFYGWVKVKTVLKHCCSCSCFDFANLSGGNTFYFNNDIFDEDDVESLTWSENEIHSEEATDKIGPLKSAPPVERPKFQRLNSEPSEIQSKAKPEFLRSHSHPGCLKELNKEQCTLEHKTETPNKYINEKSPTKIFAKSEYSAVPTTCTDPELPDYTDQDNMAGTVHFSSDQEVPDLIYQGPAAEREEMQKLLSPPFFLTKDQSTSTTGIHKLSIVSAVPGDFQAKLLRGKMSDIPIKFYKSICIKLDTPRSFWDDNRLFGEKIGLSKQEVSFLTQKKDATDLMIQQFDSHKGSTIAKFKEIVEGMGRDDVVSVIEDWIVSEWNASCSSSVVL